MTFGVVDVYNAGIRCRPSWWKALLESRGGVDGRMNDVGERRGLQMVDEGDVSEQWTGG